MHVFVRDAVNRHGKLLPLLAALSDIGTIMQYKVEQKMPKEITRSFIATAATDRYQFLKIDAYVRGINEELEHVPNEKVEDDLGRMIQHQHLQTRRP